MAAVPVAVPPTEAAAQACPVISGYVYYDVNNNGLREPGEPPIASTPIELRNGAGAVVGSTSTDAAGYYEFLSDTSASIPTQAITHSASFPTTTTDWTLSREIPRFDPALGTLRSVEISASATITSTMKAESLDIDTATITAVVAGALNVTAPGGKTLAAAPTNNAGSFDAAPYDGTANFSGPSGHDFGANSATDSTTTTITDVAGLAAFSGAGSASFQASVLATSRTTGGGNVLNEIHTNAGAELQVVYRYTPTTCLKAGPYTIVETAQPAGYSDGRETAGNVTPIPGSQGSDSIPVVLSGADLPNNNFGELKSSIHGCVYVDLNDNGLREQGEPPIPGVTITLSGAANATQLTAGDGCYLFTALTAGLYAVNETQPSAYLDGKDTIGTPGGKTSNDRHFEIQLPAAYNGIFNNFGELLPPNPTPTPTPPGNPGCTPGSSGCPTPGCTPGTSGCTPPGSGTPGNPGCTAGSPGCSNPGGGPGGNSGGSTSPGQPGQPPIVTVASGQPGTPPGAPGAGSGLLDRAANMNVVFAGILIFAASGWLAFLALGRRRDEGTD